MRRSIVLVFVFVCLFAGIFIFSLASAGPSTAAGEIRLVVDYDGDWAYTETDPMTQVEFTVTGNGGVKATASGTTDDQGSLGTWDLAWQPPQPDIEVGDSVKVTNNGSVAEINPVGMITAVMDLDNDTIAGTIDAPGQNKVTVNCNIFTDNNPVEKEIKDVSGNKGSYVCDFSGEFDIQANHDGNVSYTEADGDSVQKYVSPPWFRANIAHDWVGGNYSPGHTFNITLKDSTGAVKDTAVSESMQSGGWGGDGFETQDEEWAGGRKPDIMEGDSVLFVADDGFSRTLRIGTINGLLDVDLDKIEGTLNVPWLNRKLPVECHPWGAPGGAPGKDSKAAANGSSMYQCQWDPTTEWDILPGQDVAVMYIEADRDRVINVFREDAANLQVNKWSAGSNVAAPGGTAVFVLEVRNDGSAAAGNVTVTDTLPLDLSYAADSSGLTPTIVGDQVTWDIGDLAVGDSWVTYLVTENMAEPGDVLTNVADAETAFDEDPGNNQSETDLNIEEGDPDLNIGINNNPGEPAPGETFLYRLYYGNNGPVPSGEATIVVNLPDVVSVVEWQSREGYNLWEGSENNNQLTLKAPAVPGNWGDQLYLRVKLDDGVLAGDCYPVDTTISTTGDSNPDDNEGSNEFCVGNPAAAARVGKWFNWGTLYPGGELEYHIYLEADGNIPTELTLEDALPVGTSFEQAWVRDGTSQLPFPPDADEDGLLTWDLGEVEPGTEFDINLRLRIDQDAQPLSELLNCAMVDSKEGDIRPFDNKSCVADMLQPTGPNLRVEKWHQWRDEQTVEFHIQVKNLGSTTLQDVQIVDTYPEYTTFNDDWWFNFWEEVTLLKHQPGQRKLTWEVNRIEPNWAFEINFVVDLDQDKAGTQGLSYTNLVSAAVANDVYPADNTYTDVATTGPDLFVVKRLDQAQQMIAPGEQISFVVEFGNANNWPWNAEGDTLLEDILPAGLKFVSATHPGDNNQAWEPVEDGNMLQWSWGPMNEGERHTFEITVEVEDNVVLGSVLTNEFKIKSLDPKDIDPVTENNMDTAEVKIGTSLYLPVILTK